LCDAGVVFDEIHAYDDLLFGTLLRFLSALPGIPVLMMSASLPPSRLEAIRRVAHGRGALLEEIAGPDDLETLPRYRALTCRDPWTATRTILDRCGKIL